MWINNVIMTSYFIIWFLSILCSKVLVAPLLHHVVNPVQPVVKEHNILAGGGDPVTEKTVRGDLAPVLHHHHRGPAVQAGHALRVQDDRDGAEQDGLPGPVAVPASSRWRDGELGLLQVQAVLVWADTTEQ